MAFVNENNKILADYYKYNITISLVTIGVKLGY